jgi:tetratricopeptide (TPR) repeat protein
MWHFWLDYYAGDPDSAHRHAQQALEISERIGDAFSRTWSWRFYGAAQIGLGRPEAAIEALKRSLELSRKHRTAVEGSPWSVLWLSDAHRELGNVAKALELAREGLEMAQAQESPTAAAFGGLILARALLASGDEAAFDELESVLSQVSSAVREMEYRTYEPLIHVELAELARRRGDADARQRELEEAYRLFGEVGADGHAQRLAGELAALA